MSPENTDLRIPMRNPDSEIIKKFLTQDLKIDPKILDVFLKNGSLYEDGETHRAVFVGRDETGTPRYAAFRGGLDAAAQVLPGSDTAYGFFYEGPGKNLFVFEDPIELLSFLSLYPADWKERNYLSLGGLTDDAIHPILRRFPWIDDIRLCLGDDAEANAAVAGLVQAIPADINVTRLLPVRKDWNSVLREKDSLGRKYCREPVSFREQPDPVSIPVIRMSDVKLKPVDWLWYPYIPFGKLTIVQGNPGEGKTTFALRLAAACTTSAVIPGMREHAPMNVLYQTAEDGLGDTIKPRLMEAQADLDRVILIDETKSGLTLTDGRIEKAIRENNVRLAIFDPIQAFIGSRTDINRANEIRPIMRTLGEIAERTGCAILLIGHLNKSSGTTSAYRGLGSIDFRAAVRSILLIGRVKNDPTIRVICHDKSSLVPEGKSMAFSLDPERGFEWIGEYDISAEDLLGGRSGDTMRKQELAKQMILDALAGKSEISAEELDDLAMEAGIGERTLRMAKSELRDAGLLDSKRKGKSWFYARPKQGTAEQDPGPVPDRKSIDWSDPKQRAALIAAKLGCGLVDCTDRLALPGKSETAENETANGRQTAECRFAG